MTLVQTDEQREAEIEHRTQQRVAAALAGLPDHIESAVEAALRRVINDPEVQRRYWENGYKEFERHASANLAQAIGRRVIMFVVTAVVGMALAWSWLSGRER